MSSLKSLAEKARNEPPIYFDHDRNVFNAAVLEIAHAIKRGRRPSSCSVLPGENIQAWLRRTFVDTHRYCRGYMGKKCSIADDEFYVNMLYGLNFGNPEAMAICHAIEICRNYIKPICVKSEHRGDFMYQERNEVTNLKKKAAWRRRNEGSCYDDDPRNYPELDDGLRNLTGLNDATDSFEISDHPSGFIRRI